MSNRSATVCVLITVLFVLGTTALGAQTVSNDTGSESVNESVSLQNIRLEGIQVWSRSTIRTLLDDVGLREGMELSRSNFRNRVDQAIERFYGEGLFSDIRASLDGNTLVFEFEEHSRISNIVFRGNETFEQQTLMDVLLLQRNDPASEQSIQEARRQIREYYSSKGFGDVTVESKIEQAVSGRVVVIFEIDEGGRRSVGDIYLEYKDGKNPLFQIGRNWSIRWRLPLAEGDPYSPQRVDEVIRVIENWYQNRGYLDVSVQTRTRVLTRDRGLELTFVIDEGPVYYTGEFNLAGNTIFSDTELRPMIPLERGDVFSKRQLAVGLREIEQRYQDRGYANATVFDPANFRINKDEEDLRAHVDVRISEGQPFYVENIELRGNEVTYDKVIMREVTLEEGDLLDGQKKRNSLRRLRNLGYFKTVEMNVDPGSKENTKIVRIRVEERPTGELSFGGGFSSSTGFVGSLSISKNNFSLYDWSNGFTGRGQSLSLSASVGDERNNFNISWDDPWFNSNLDDPDEPSPEVPISVGWSAFNTSHERLEGFDEIRTGGALRLGREFGAALSNKVDIEYSFESIEVDNLDAAGDDAPDRFEEEAERTGDTDGFVREVGSLNLGLQRDRRDDSRFPSEGYFLRWSNEVATEYFGGNSDYYKPTLESRFYIPFWGGTFWAWRLNYKTIDTWADESGDNFPIPSFEEFFLGGHRDVRGYESNDIAIYDGNNKEGGGSSAYYTNLELRYQLIQETMQMYLFGDAGQVSSRPWTVEATELKKSAGIGFRVRSPIGPINISWARRLDETFEGANDAGEVQLDFSIGTGF
jgi:outer membrane protein insertion porin family